MMKCIAIDYDGTWTYNEKLMGKLVDTMADACVPVVCATSRSGSDSDRQEMRKVVPKWIPIVFCGNQYKLSCLRAVGYDPIYTIDDQPESWVFPEPIWVVRWWGAWKWFLKRLGFA